MRRHTRVRATIALLTALFILASFIASLGEVRAETVPGTDVEGLGPTPVEMGSIDPLITETGQISLSVDGLGTNSSSGGTIQVAKPAGATVRKAFMAAASTGFSGRVLANGDVKIDGAPVAWSLTTRSSISSWNSWAEVTSLVKPKLDAAPTGRVNFAITEVNTIGIDGELLAVIFDDPNQTTTNTVALLFGAQAVGGDTFNIRFAEPIDKSDPNLALDMSLGISFGFQPSGQYSRVDVNGQRLTTSAGGQDDGAPANGALLTVGGLDDSNTNPANPFATDSGGPRTDDELYNLLPFVNTGDSTISVFTVNPSSDDNIFFGAFSLRGAAAVIGEGIVLAPLFEFKELGTQHTVMATVQNSLGNPIANRNVTFTITTGPHAGRTHTAPTNANGQASFSYTGTSTGQDTIEASFVDSQGNTKLSNLVNAAWVKPRNTPPTANAGGPYTVAEGGSVTLSGSGSDVDGEPLTYKWDLDNDGIFETAGQNVSFSAANLDGPTSHTVVLRVCDDEPACDTSSTTVDVTNVAPTAAITGAPSSGPEGKPISLSSTITDPSAADTAAGFNPTWSVTKNGNPYASGSGASFSFTPDDNGTYVVSLNATDKDGGVGSDSKTITVTNVAPAVSNVQVNQATIDENGSVTLSGTISDPGMLDTFTLAITWGDGSTTQTANLAAGATSFSVTHQYLDDNPTATASDVTAISVTVTDKDGDSSSGSASVTITNVAPAISGVTGPSGPLALGTAANLGATFTDVGTKDSHACTFSWDDGSADTTMAGSSGSCAASRTYAAAGVYTVTVTVTDDDTGSASSKFEYVVVYDPSAGFVTGGGTITSPAGAYTADPSLSGKANFGFVSKYQKGTTTPTGQTEFQFHAAGFNFHSSSYYWLVVSGAKGQYKGTGTVNGVGGYEFLLTVTDGQVTGGGGVDKFRIRIWNAGGVVYDNVVGAPLDIDSANPQAIATGSIVIHSGKK